LIPEDGRGREPIASAFTNGQITIEQPILRQWAKVWEMSFEIKLGLQAYLLNSTDSDKSGSADEDDSDLDEDEDEDEDVRLKKQLATS